MTAAKEIPTPAPEPVLREDQVDYTPTARSVSLSRHSGGPARAAVGASADGR